MVAVLYLSILTVKETNSMDQAEFDKFADEYHSMHAANIRISGEGPKFFAEYKIKDVVNVLMKRRLISKAKILDFGAGTGNSIPFFRKHIPSADLTCLDVSTKSLEIGKSQFAEEAKFVQFEGDDIPFEDKTFNIVFASCVFHHIDHAEHVRIFREMHRILANDGLLFIFEHNPYNPLTLHAVNTCPFDENAKLIRAPIMKRRIISAGFSNTKINYRIFFPGPLRFFRPLESAMTWLPLGAQYFLYADKNAG